MNFNKTYKVLKTDTVTHICVTVACNKSHLKPEEGSEGSQSCHLLARALALVIMEIKTGNWQKSEGKNFN